MTDPRNVRRWLKTLADNYPSLLVSGVSRNALAEIKALEAKLSTAVEALERLGSCEAFVLSRPTTEEDRARIDFARAALAKIKE